MPAKHIILFFSIFSVIFHAEAQNSFNNDNIRSLRFIEGIEINGSAVNSKVSKDKNFSENVNKENQSIPISHRTEQLNETALTTIEYLTSINFKYGQLLNTEVELLKNISLYTFIEEWLNTRYLYGGETKSGIDCSGFSGALLKSVFGIKLPRTAREQYQHSEKISPFEMAEGDLVFFNTSGGVSHVGVYLANDYFVHSSTSQGVTISNLNEDYYKKRFIGSGRVISASNDQAMSAD